MQWLARSNINIIKGANIMTLVNLIILAISKKARSKRKREILRQMAVLDMALAILNKQSGGFKA